jgi:hypothetical protein
VTAWWLNEVADVRLPRSTGKTPRQRHAEELPQLLPLPACDFQADPVVYRTVDAEGFVAWRGNRYAVPYCHIGRLLPVRLSETALIIYGPDLHEMRQQEHLRELLGDQPLSPRPAADYRIFFTEDLPHVETTPPTPPADADRSDAAAPSDDAAAGPPPSAAEPPEQPEDRPGGPDP